MMSRARAIMPTRDRLRTLTDLALRWLLGGLFLWAGVIKLADPKTFARSIDAFGLIPEPLLPPVAVALPVLELLVGLAVLRRWRGGLPAMAGLLLLFLAVLGYAIGQQLDIDCGCFSLAERREQTSVQAAFARDLLMLAGVLVLGMFNRCRKEETQGGIPPICEREEMS